MAPNAIARLVAGQLWPDVQRQYKLTKGVFAFSCAGHGGIVAVIGVADLPNANVEAARELGMTEIVVNAGANYTSVTRDRKALTDYARSGGYPCQEVWIGEEDCDWATIALASEQVRTGMSAAGYSSEIDYEHAYASCRSWNERYLKLLDPDYNFDPNGRVVTEQVAKMLLDAGSYLRCSAAPCDANGVKHTGNNVKVHVLFRNKDGDKIGRYMTSETYNAIPLGKHATVADYELLGEVEPAPGEFNWGTTR